MCWINAKGGVAMCIFVVATSFYGCEYEHITPSERSKRYEKAIYEAHKPSEANVIKGEVYSVGEKLPKTGVRLVLMKVEGADGQLIGAVTKDDYKLGQKIAFVEVHYASHPGNLCHHFVVVALE